MNQTTAGTPTDVTTKQTVDFLASRLRAGADVLEVGCGEGHVAAELTNRGYRTVAVDSDPRVIERARERGVQAEVAGWPDFDASPVDAIVFSRSLHHIEALREAVLKSRQLLKPTGLLLVEDFAFDEADEPTIRWFLEVLRSDAARALIDPAEGELVTRLLGATDAMEVWRHSHDHELHTVAAMTEALAELFDVEELRPVPYLYRYLVPVLPETARAAAFVDRVMGEEASRGTRQEIALIGRRLVGSARRCKPLFVYGTLCPGRPNEHVLENIGGIWEQATIRGHLKQLGWGAGLGYPVIVLDQAGDEVEGFLFRSENLDRHWAELDAFEGAEYQRVSTTVRNADGAVEAYVYVLAER